MRTTTRCEGRAPLTAARGRCFDLCRSEGSSLGSDEACAMPGQLCPVKSEGFRLSWFGLKGFCEDLGAPTKVYNHNTLSREPGGFSEIAVAHPPRQCRPGQHTSHHITSSRRRRAMRPLARM
eukprot:7324495-Prymnesium_polylepis.2